MLRSRMLVAMERLFDARDLARAEYFPRIYLLVLPLGDGKMQSLSTSDQWNGMLNALKGELRVLRTRQEKVAKTIGQVDETIGRVDLKMEMRIGRVEGKIGTSEERMRNQSDRIEQRIAKVEQRVEERLNGVEGKLSQLDQKLDQLLFLLREAKSTS
jgi:outer membrane protein TolC